MQILCRAVKSHQFLSKRYLNGTNQHRLSNTCRLADCVDTKVEAVNKIHINMPRRAEHDAIPGGGTRRAMTRRVSDEIRLCFDNRSTARSLWRVANQPMPEQFGRDNLRGRSIE